MDDPRYVRKYERVSGQCPIRIDRFGEQTAIRALVTIIPASYSNLSPINLSMDGNRALTLSFILLWAFPRLNEHQEHDHPDRAPSCLDPP